MSDYKYTHMLRYVCFRVYFVVKSQNTKYSGKKGIQVFYNCKYVILIVDTL